MNPADQPPPNPEPPGEPRESAPTPEHLESGRLAVATRPGRRQAGLIGVVVLIAAAAGTGLGVAVALPGLLPGPSTAPGPSQPSYVIDTQATPAPTVRAAIPAASPAPVQYTVEAGDTLRSIADTLYGDANLWPTLYEANRDTIGPDPDALRVGMRLRAPSR